MTDQKVKGLRCAPGERLTIKDPSVPGLEMRASATSKSWSMTFVSPTTKKRSRVTLGRYPTVDLAAARKAARVYRVELDQRRDPRRSQTVERRKAAGGITFNTLADQWLKDHSEANKSAGSAKADRNNLKRPDGPRDLWGDVAVDTISRAEVVAYLERVKEKYPVQANRLQALLHSIFRWGVNRGHSTINPISGLDRIGGEEKPRERALTDAELGVVWRELSDDESANGPVIRAVLKFIIATACRVSEACELPKAELRGLKTDQPEWHLSAARAKNNRALIVPLSGLAVAQIEAAADRQAARPGEQGKFVFNAVGLATPTSRYAAASCCGDIVERTGLEPFTPHDLRRTVATLMQRLGVPLEVIQWTLNHKIGNVTGRHYGQYDYLKERRGAAEKVAAHILTLTA